MADLIGDMPVIPLPELPSSEIIPVITEIAPGVPEIIGVMPVPMPRPMPVPEEDFPLIPAVEPIQEIMPEVPKLLIAGDEEIDPRIPA